MEETRKQFQTLGTKEHALSPHMPPQRKFNPGHTLSPPWGDASRMAKIFALSDAELKALAVARWRPLESRMPIEIEVLFVLKGAWLLIERARMAKRLRFGGAPLEIGC